MKKNNKIADRLDFSWRVFNLASKLYSGKNRKVSELPHLSHAEMVREILASYSADLNVCAAAEKQAKLEFKKVYARNAVMTNNIDENAVMIIAYGLLPLHRNLASEATAIKTFKWVYGHAPVNALAWNIVRSIAYSGARR